MAAGTTPTIYDQKVLASVAGLGTTANTTIYTAPTGENSVQIDSIIVVNKTAGAVNLALQRKDQAGNRYFLAGTISIPTGLAINILANTGPVNMQSNGTAAEVLDGSAGTASALDIQVNGVEKK